MLWLAINLDFTHRVSALGGFERNPCLQKVASHAESWHEESHIHSDHSDRVIVSSAYMPTHRHDLFCLEQVTRRVPENCQSD